MKRTAITRLLAKLLLVLAPVIVLSACTGNDPGAAESELEEAVPEAAGDDDLATVTSYELTMDKMNRFYDAHRNMAIAMRDMTPEERERHDLSMDADDTSLDALAAGLESDEVVREAIEDAGLTTREYAVLTMAVFQAGMAAAVIGMRPDADPDSIMQEMEVNPANVRFMQEHGAELEARQQEMEAELERMGVTE